MTVTKVQQPPVPAGGLSRYDVFEIADRVVAEGAYARFSQLEQLAVCLWITERCPSPGQGHAITIIVEPSPILTPEEQARRMCLAYGAAEAVLTNGRLPIARPLDEAIEAVLDAASSLLNAETPASIGAVRVRADLRTALADLRTTFKKEQP